MPSRYEHSLCCRDRTEDGSSARCRVDQPRTQTKGKGSSGDGRQDTDNFQRKKKDASRKSRAR
jgi:hypothetical protein